jgi:hypothetical protein
MDPHRLRGRGFSAFHQSDALGGFKEAPADDHGKLEKDLDAHVGFAFEDFHQVGFEKTNEDRFLDGNCRGGAEVILVDEGDFAEKTSLGQNGDEHLTLRAACFDRDPSFRNNVHPDPAVILLKDGFFGLVDAFVNEVGKVGEFSPVEGSEKNVFPKGIEDASLLFVSGPEEVFPNKVRVGGHADLSEKGVVE